ncbi:MAG: cysteine--tRNA ligase [Dehalococcoidia bacterium]|nr:cysteine--tRNA ligase [Dehalococcoidia bacterium]
MIQIYDSYSKKYKEVNSKSINIYVCGITTSDYCHLGHAFSSVSFEILDRFLSSQGFDVTRIQNFTDVDDKIIAKSLEEEISTEDVSKKYIKAFFEDMDALGVKRANLYPKATDEISNIIEFIKKLEKKNLTYSINGSIYFRVSKFEKYGMLSSRDISNSLSGTRVNDNLNKESDGDFALWKSSKPDEPFWESPWGKGRPGWHIECSSMVLNTIGDTVDIHGGGIDLIFPHHENEIAQSESLNGKKFANIWMHNGMVKIQGEKMSKSLGNLIKLKDAIKIFGVDLLRMWILSSHYRKPLLYDEKIINSFSKPLKRIKDAKNLIPAAGEKKLESKKEFDEFNLALSNDLNTSVALSQIISLSKKINNSKNELDISFAQSNLNKMLEITGLCQNIEDENNDKNIFIDIEIEHLIDKRNNYRKNKEFTKADEIRDQLLKKGIEIIDNGFSSTWKKS